MKTYGLNVGSLLPWCLGPKGAERSIRMAKEAGYDGVQALPMMGWDYTRLSQWGADVISFEDAWSFGSLWQIMLGYLGVKRYSYFSLKDRLLFGRVEFPRTIKEINQNAIPSMHEDEALHETGGTKEITPDFWNSRIEVLRYVAEGGKICWDTYHVRRPFHAPDNEKYFGSWRSLLYSIPRDSIGLVHVHVIQEELEDFLGRWHIEFVDMLHELRLKKVECPVIVEVFPPLTTPRKLVSFHQELLIAVKRWLE